MQNLPSILTPDFGLLFWMLVAFLIIFFLLKKFAFGAITGAVEQRKNFIDESLKNAREANERLANIKQEGENILRQAHEKQSEIIQTAMETRESIIRNARNEAQAEGAKMLNEAKAQIQAEKESALRDIRSQVASLSVKVAEKVVQRELNDDAKQEQFIERLLNEVAEP